MTFRSAEFFAFIREREGIRLRRAGGGPFPWTKDPILLQYKFTNVKRAHDRTSRELVRRFYRPHEDDKPELVLLNAALARYFGRVEFMDALGWQTGFRPKTIIKLAMKRMEQKLPVFTGAYIVTSGNTSGPKPETVVNNYITSLWEHRKAIVGIAHRWDCWRPTIEHMMDHCAGFGGSGFMAKETILDVRYTNAFWKRGRPKDMNEWTPIGPGTMRGVSRILGVDKPADRRKQPKASPRDTLDVCRELFLRSKRANNWPVMFVKLELSDIAFQLCEFDKYERVRLGQGKPRSLYRPPPGITQYQTFEEE